MRTGRVVFGVKENGLVIGQVAKIKGEDGLDIQVNQAGDTVPLEVGNAHKPHNNIYQIKDYLGTIEIGLPDFMPGDPVYYKQDGRVGKVAKATDKTVVVGFGTTLGTGKRCNPADLINLRGKLDEIESVVMDAIGMELGDESLPSPEHAQTMAETNYDYNHSLDDANETADEDEEEEDEG